MNLIRRAERSKIKFEIWLFLCGERIANTGKFQNYKSTYKL